jgi:hypothetical protein
LETSNLLNLRDARYDEVLSTCRRLAPARLAKRIERMLAESVRVELIPGAPVERGASKFGGIPDLPRTLSWPRWHPCYAQPPTDDLRHGGARGTPLSFIAQFRMADLSRIPVGKGLPPTGSDKERSTDRPSWAPEPEAGETGEEYARRACDDKYGQGNYKRGADSEFSKLKKWLERRNR